MSRHFVMLLVWYAVLVNVGPESNADVWNAGEDMVAAERDAFGSNRPATETNFQNQIVPVWSYGTRTAAQGWQSDAFTGSGSSFHVNNFSNGFFTPNTFDGFVSGSDGSIFVNYTNVASPHFQGFVDSHEIFMHPSSGNSLFSVIRFTAPETAVYGLAANWRHLNTANPGDGGSGHIVLNGVEVNTQTWAAADGSNHTFSTNVLSMQFGDHLDFVIDAGVNNNYNSDSTAFNATISTSAVPEPSSVILCASVIGGIGIVRRIKKHVFKHA